MTQVVVDDKLIRHITDTIVQRFHPRRIVLFGSHARGDASPDSDIDLLVEMESDKNFFERTLEVLEVFGLRPWSMDLFVYTPEEVQRDRRIHGTLMSIVEREGKVLYERP